MNTATTRTLLLLLILLASAAVLVGALAKIQGWPAANMLLGAGMITEVLCAAGFVIISWKSRRKG